MNFDYESFPGFGFIEQDIDDSIKLQMLFAELNRLERTMEIHGTPFVFVDDEKIRFCVDSGKKRFEGHKSWLKDIICEGSLDNPGLSNRTELLRSILDCISKEDVHPYVLFVLAQIIAIKGVKSFCGGAWAIW